LQEAKVSVIGESGNADDGERAGLGSDDGKSYGPPRDVAVSQEVVAQRSLCLAKTQAEGGDSSQIYRDDYQIRPIQDACRNLLPPFSAQCRNSTYQS